jgi:catechol O-methyltransferase
VHVVVGPCDRSVERLKAEGELDHIDMLFIDHYKPAYTFDLKLCESLGLVREGSMIIADNVIHP